MAAGDRTISTIRGLRVVLDERLGWHESQLVLAWARAWSEIRDEWVGAIEDLVASSRDGVWPSRTQIARAKRAQAAMELTTQMLDELCRDFQVRALKDIPTFTGIGASWSAKLMASQMPESDGTVASLAANFDKVDGRALDAIVERTTQRIVATSAPISQQATHALSSVLVRGVALGEHPSVVAKNLLDRLQGQFNGGRTRAAVIARTELLDAYRAAAYGQEHANAGTLRGWQWIAQLDKRTCPSCWSMHGTVHDLEEPGPLDHQQGRCARLPRIKSWRELGIDLDEPEDVLPIGLDVFDGLPREDQLAIMGPQRLKMLDSGFIEWDDLAKRRSNSGWRDSYAPASTSDLLRIGNQRRAR